MIGFISFIGLIIIIPSSILASRNIIEDFNYPTWIGIFTGISSLTLAIFYSNRDDRKENEVARSIDELNSSINEMKNTIQTIGEVQQSQNEQLNTIEKELKDLSIKSTTTNFFPIIIKDKKEKDSD